MKLSSASIFFLAGALSSAVTAASTETQSTCQTAMGTKKRNPVPTQVITTSSTLSPVRVTVTSIPTTTVRPTSTKVESQLVSSTSTFTDVALTSTFSTTSTILETTSTLVTAYSTEFTTTISETQTLSASTYTVPAPASFTPFSESGLQSPPAARRAVGAGSLQARQALALEPRAQSKDGVLANKFPQSVTCTKLLIVHPDDETITVQGSRTETSYLPASTVTSLSFSTTVSTLTVQPTPVSVTSSFSTTETTTLTGTTTLPVLLPTTTTIQESPPTATVYAACQANNLIDNFNGAFIGDVNWKGGGFTAAGITDATKCCEFCQRTPTCAGSALYEGRCLIINGGSCPAAYGQASNSNVALYAAFVTKSSIVFSNGACNTFYGRLVV